MSYCHIGLVLPLHYSAIIEKSGSHFVQREVVFALVSSILVHYSEEIPALNDTIVLHLLLDGGHFGLRPS